MTKGQLKDFVREHFGRLDLPTSVLDLALDEGRKLIEKEGNFWWMRATTDFNLVIAQQDYTIEESGDIDIINFKDARALHWKEPDDVSWDFVNLGTKDQEELDLMYDEDDDGNPEFAVIDNITLKVWPPSPDVAYDMRLYHYNWTDNPAGNNETDDLLKNYGLAVGYGAIIWGFEIELKDVQGAAYWRNLLGGTPFGRGGEINKIKRENLKRDWKDKIMLVPYRGAGHGTKRSMDNVQIYNRR